MRLIKTDFHYGKSLRGLGDQLPCSQMPAGVAQNPGVNCIADPWYAWFLTTTGMLVTGGALLAVFYFRHHSK